MVPWPVASGGVDLLGGWLGWLVLRCGLYVWGGEVGVGVFLVGGNVNI